MMTILIESYRDLNVWQAGIELAEDAYRNGQGEIQAVLRSREKRLQLLAAKLDALREFHLARVRHETSLGK